MWKGLAAALLLIFLAEKLIFISSVSSLSEGYFHDENKINFLPFDVFKSYFKIGNFFESILFYIFWIGLAITLFNLLISFDLMRNDKGKSSRSDLFNIIAIVATLSLFIFILRSPNSFGDPRWYLPLAMSSFMIISKTLIMGYEYLKQYNKYASLIIILLLLAVPAMKNISISNDMITSRVSSFQGIKDAGLFLKEISSEDDLILSQPMPQTAYYSERKVTNIQRYIGWEGLNDQTPYEESMAAIASDPSIKYFLVSFSEPNHPSWMKHIGQINQNGQAAVSSWEIPFMDTKIDFASGTQDIKESKTFGDITFKLIALKQDVFIYEIIRS